MAETLKVLGQSAPSATTATILYTVGAGLATVASSLVICNRAATAGTFRVAIRPTGATLANEHYIFYDAELPANSTTTIIIGLTLATTDVVTVYASSANFSFNLFGSEVGV